MNQIDAGNQTRETAKPDRLANVDDQGVEFRDPYSSRIIKFTPEMSVRAQHQIGADMMMAFDELTNISDPYEYNVEALERTRVWAERSLTEHIKQTNLRADKPYQALYGVLQGGHWRDLREKAARDLGAITIQTRQFDGFGLGGAFEKETLGETIGWMTALLPDNKPRHLLGLSQPDDIFDGVANGADTFDCVAPTREARHGRVYTTRGNLSLKRAEFTDDTRPIDETCDCPTCNIQKYTKISSFAGLSGESLSKQVQDDKGFYSRADLRALLKSPDPHEKQRAMTLLSQHNVRFVVHLFEQIRAHLIAGDFAEFRAEWLDDYYQKRSSRRVS
jgi:queuine tRNA-ribosyltransferase